MRPATASTPSDHIKLGKATPESQTQRASAIK